MKRRAWEEAGRGEALPALPSGLDEDDRKRVREIGGEPGEVDNKNKRIRVSEDIDAMSDEDWSEYIDEIRDRRSMVMIVTDIRQTGTCRYMNRACTLAEMQNSLGAYYIIEVPRNREEGFSEHLNSIEGQRIELGNSIV